MASCILVHIGSGNGLLSDSTKLLPEPMLLIYPTINEALQQSFASSFIDSVQEMHPYYEFENYIFKSDVTLRRVNE